ESRPVLEENVGVAGARDDLLEQVPRHVVGRQAALAVQGTGEAVFVLEAEDPALHVGFRVTGERPRGKSHSEGASAAPPAGALGGFGEELVEGFGGDAAELAA